MAASLTVSSLNIDRKFILFNNSCVYAAQLTAIMEVVLWILNSDYSNKWKFAIFSDSLSVFRSIKKSCSQSRPNL